jgi:hypothetical protein
MRKISLIGMVLFMNIYLSAQIKAYYPDGRRIVNDCITNNCLFEIVGLKQYESFFDDDGEVYFKKLSNTPVIIIDDHQPPRIKKLINSYDYNSYINSFHYYYTLRDMMKEGTLTKAYLLDVFGKPTEVYHFDNKSESWIFKNNNAKVIFLDDRADSVNVINFNELDKFKFSIPHFQGHISSSSVGFDISFQNLSPKDIKYIYTTISLTNSVEDKIETKTVTSIGPIRQNEIAGYNYDYLFNSKLAKYLRIEKIKIRYFDGSTRIINKIDIPNIRLYDWEAIGKRPHEEPY